ncbi:MAG: hypothetical protein JOZ43_06825 [Acidobacteriales bacterium]|nr:hypothetical protein [Terriglobales bacterium]
MHVQKKIFALAILASSAALTAQTAPLPKVGNCNVFPADNIWNTPVDSLPVSKLSATYLSHMSPTRGLHADFDSIGDGIPYITAPGTPKATVSFQYASQSDPGPYVIPDNSPIENGSDAHVISIDTANCVLYELWSSQHTGSLKWQAGSGAVFDLKGDGLRPNGWTSADAAGLPVFPGLVRYSEVAAGQINHALRITFPQTQKAYVWPARHDASSITNAGYIPMGARVRLKASFNIAAYPADVQVVLKALKKYGAFVADNGSAWYISGVPDSRWNDTNMHKLGTVLGSNFEVVDESSLMVVNNSARVAYTPAY